MRLKLATELMNRTFVLLQYFIKPFFFFFVIFSILLKLLLIFSSVHEMQTKF